MDSGFSNMLENTRKYFQGIPTDAASTAAAAAAAAAAAQLHFPPPMPPSHHLHHNGGGGGRSSMNSSSSSSSSSSEPSSATATDRFAGYHHPHLRYNFQPYSSPGHYPRTAVDPKPAAFQHHHFQPPSPLQYHHQPQQQQQQQQPQQQQQHHHQLPPSASSSSSPPSPYKSPYTLQPLQPPPLTVKQQQQQPPPSQFKPMSAARLSPPVSAAGKQYSPPKPPQSPYAVVPKSTSGAPQPQSPFTAPKEQQPSVPETPPPSPHSSHYYNRTTHSGLQQQAIDRDYLRFKPIQTPPPPPKFQPLERPKSEVPVTSGTGLQSSHLAIRYDPKLEQPRSGVRAVPIAQAKQPSSSSSSTTAAVQHDVNRVIVQKPEPLRYNQQQQHQQQQQQQQHQHQINNNHPHRSSTLSDDHHHHHQKRPASVQPSYLESRPFQIKPYDGGNNNSNGSSSNGSSGSGQSSSASSYHRPFTLAPQPLPPSSQASAAIIVSGMDHRWAAFDGRAPPSFLQQQSSSSSTAAVINGYHHHHRPPPPSSSSLPATVVSQHHQHHSLSRQQQQSQHYPLNLQKLTQPARPATAAGQLQQPVKTGQENKTAKLRFETTKRESPLDLSVKTVCRSADSTDDRLNPFGHDIPKVNFKPDFNRSLPGTAAATPPQTAVVVVGGQQHQQHNNAATAAYNHHHQFAPQISLSLPPPTPLPPPPPTVVVVQSSPQQPLPSVAAAPTTPLPPIVRSHHHPHNNNYQVPPLSSADEAWRAAIDRQIEQKFSSYTSSKKQPHPLHQYQQFPQHQHLHHPIPPTAIQHQQQRPPSPLPPPPPPQQGPAQADKRVLEILKQNIEARDQSSRPQIAEAPSTPAMVFSTPIRKEPSATPLKKTDYYMAERTAVTPFPKKIDYYMDRSYCNAPRIRTKAERKQISAEGSSSGTRMSSPMAAATAISPHPFLPSNNSAPQAKQEPTPLTQTEAVIDLKLDIKREPSPIKEPDLSLLTKEEPEKDEDDEDFWTNTCNSFVVQLAETQEKKKVKTPVKRKSAKELQPQPPKRKYTKRIKVEPITGTDKGDKSSDVRNTSKVAEEVKSEKSPLLGNVICEETSQKDAEPSDMDKENKTKLEDPEKNMDDTKNKEDNEEKSAKGKPGRKRLLKPLIAKVKKIKKEHKKELKLKELKKETKKEEKKELKKAEKKDKDTVKKEQLPKLEKKELAAVTKEEKKGLKKEEKRDLKKDQQQPDHGNKKDFNKKESKKTEAARKKVVVEKENLTKNTENTSRRSASAAAAAAIEVASKFNPRQSLRRKNSLKDYTFAFDELLDDAFAHFETVKIPVKRRRKCASPSPSPAPTVVAATVGTTQVIAVVKKAKEKDNETIRMRLRSRNRPLQAKQEPQQASSKKKANAKNKIIPKRRRKKSLGEKSAHTATVVSTTEDWKDELYKFKRSLRLPSKLISVVSPPTAGAVAADQVSLTSIMNIPPHSKPAKESKAAKSAACQSLQAVGLGTLTGKNKPKRLGGHMFGRRDVMFKGRRLMKREKIVSAEKLMQRNLRKRRQREDEVMKKGCAGEEVTASHLDDEDDEDEEEVHAGVEECDGDAGASGVKPPARMLFKRKLMRKKFRSGFDYIKKKKKKEPVSDKKPATSVTSAAAASISVPPSVPRYVSEIHAEIKGWIVNKGHGETVLHRAARLGVNDVVGYCMEKLEYAPSVADNAGYTPLHEACSQGHYHIAKLLLLFGADVSASAQGGIRPLHEAVENGDVHLVRLLLSYGADPHLATYSGQSPLSLATDKQTRMLLEHHVNDVQGYGSASVWNFDDSTLTREPEDVDRLLWSLPPAPADDGPSFEFEFADQSLPDVYKLPSNGGADGRKATAAGVDDDDWVLFADVSTALSVKTAEALAKLLDDENAVTSVPADRFNERAVLRKSLGRQPAAVPATAAASKSRAAERPPKDKDDDSVAAKEASSSTSSTSASTSVSTSSTTTVSTAAATTTTTAITTSAVSSSSLSSSTSSGEQILLVRYDHKLKQLLGVDVYTVS